MEFWASEVTHLKLIINVIIVMIIVGTDDIKAFIPRGALGIMTIGVIRGGLEDVCKQFPANT